MNAKPFPVCEQKALNLGQTASGTNGQSEIRLIYRGPIPSYKNNKMLIPVSAKALKRAVDTGQMEFVRKELASFLAKRPLLITKPEYQQEMEQIIRSFVSQLQSAGQTAAGQTCPESSTRSWIASSVPADDAWTWIREIEIKGELCEPGEEGASITITRL